jgi:hypothetical protein
MRTLINPGLESHPHIFKMQENVYKETHTIETSSKMRLNSFALIFNSSLILSETYMKCESIKK